jgi:hypothetical protein
VNIAMKSGKKYYTTIRPMEATWPNAWGFLY